MPDFVDIYDLSNPAVVRAILRSRAKAVCDRLPSAVADGEESDLIRKYGTTVARIFLGEVPEFRGRGCWNEPGCIDADLAGWLCLGDSNHYPDDVILLAFSRMIVEIQDSGSINRANLILDRYTRAFCGEFTEGGRSIARRRYNAPY